MGIRFMMVSVKNTEFYSNVLKELHYSFGSVYIFKGFVISEMNTGITSCWENQGELVAADVAMFLGTMGDDVIYISNRINPYAVIATDWVKFFKAYKLKHYLIVSNSKMAVLNYAIENLFFKNKIKRFNSLYAAMNWMATSLPKTE